MATRRCTTRFLFTVLILLALLAPERAARAYLAPSSGMAALKVLGQVDFTSSVYGATRKNMRSPGSVAVDPVSHKVFVADFDANRVLRFGSMLALANGAAAEAVLGQPNFTSIAPTLTQRGMSQPAGVLADGGGHLWVADTGNCRVLRFDHAAGIGSGAPASAVLGQPDFTSSSAVTSASGMNNPHGLAVDAAGRLWVADMDDNRVLRFDDAAHTANGAAANGVLGQPGFGSLGSATSQNGMYLPWSVYADAAGALWVADSGNNRVLRFDNAALKGDGGNADAVLGQTLFTTAGFALSQTGMRNPRGVTVDDSSGRLYVADTSNGRVLTFDGADTAVSGSGASAVLGAADFTSAGAGVSAEALGIAYGVTFDATTRVLWVADTLHSRVLMFGAPSRFVRSVSAGSNDGWVAESGAGTGVGSAASHTGNLRIGDTNANGRLLSVLHFNTAGLPDAGITIRSAIVRIHYAGYYGGSGDPLLFWGTIEADIKRGSFGSAALTASDYQAPASAISVGNFVDAGGGWYELKLPGWALASINQTGPTQFRLQFSAESNSNTMDDYDMFFGGEALPASNRPALTVEYTKP